MLFLFGTPAETAKLTERLAKLLRAGLLKDHPKMDADGVGWDGEAATFLITDASGRHFKARITPYG